MLFSPLQDSLLCVVRIFRQKLVPINSGYGTEQFIQEAFRAWGKSGKPTPPNTTSRNRAKKAYQ
jgi:hypothetical protein